MSNETSVGNVLIISSGSGGVVAAINEYATVISLSIALLGVLAGIFFHILGVIHRNKVAKETREELKREIIKELQSERKNRD